MAKKERIAKILKRIRQIAPDPLNRDNTVLDQSSAVKVLNSVLSLGMKYRTVVKPKLDAFQENNPNVIQVSDLANLIARYPTPIDFLAQEFGYKHKPRNIMKANAIDAVTSYLCSVVSESPEASEEVAIGQWAITVKPEGYYHLGIKGFKIAGFQWLRMLFGADTVKPDRHIVNFLSDTLNQPISPLESVELIEETSAHSEFSARDIDRIVWNFMSNE